MDSFFSPPPPPPSLVLFHSRGISKRLPLRLNSIFCFVVCLQQRLKMDIGVLASLRAFKTPPMSSPRNDHIRGTAANIHSVGFISRGKQWSSSQQFFGGVVICQLFSQALFVLSRSLFFQKSENLLLVKISKHFAFEKNLEISVPLSCTLDHQLWAPATTQFKRQRTAWRSKGNS